VGSTELKVGQRIDSTELESLRRQAVDHLMLRGSMTGEQVMESLGIMVKGEGIRVMDSEGKTYIDGQSGMWVLEVGHGRKEIADAVYAQMQDLAYTTSFMGFIGNRPMGATTTLPAIKLAAKLAEITPGDLNKVSFANGGSEAVETALKMTRQYQVNNGHPRKFKFISRRGSYHGNTYGCMAVCPSLGSRHPIFEPLPPIGLQVFPPHCYRCDFGLEYPGCGIQCAEEIERVIRYHDPELIAGVIIDPVSIAQGGCVVPPKEYLPRVREICDKHEILLIDDEVINGFGRTGKMFACEHWGVVPDIMTLAKGIVSGYVPCAAIIAKDGIAAKFEGRENAFLHGYTFGGNPVSCTAALTNIEIIEREGLVENAAKMGKYMLDRLQPLYEHPTVGDIRGLGLALTIDLVKDKKTKEHFPLEVSSSLAGIVLQMGLRVNAGEHLNIAPPLIITQEEADEIIDIVDKALTKWEAEVPK